MTQVLARPRLETVQAPGIRCREIEERDLPAIVALLQRGFGRGAAFWQRAVARLATHEVPQGLPRYGCLLECRDRPVGVILLIFSSFRDGDETRVRCNVSSWYVEPDFRSQAAMLAARAMRAKDVVYVDLTPAPNTIPILAALGYASFSKGRYVAFPALCGSPRDVRVEPVGRRARFVSEIPPFESKLLADHARLGCVSLVCRSGSGRHPFVFLPRRKFGVPFADLVYCRDLAEFTRFAGAFGRYLAWRGLPIVMLDADGPLPGIPGRFSDHRPKYVKGPARPSLCDQAYSERVLFGV
jgi:hypothetical protein